MSEDKIAKRAIQPFIQDDVGQALHELADALSEGSPGAKTVSTKTIHQAIDQLKRRPVAVDADQVMPHDSNIISFNDADWLFTTSAQSSSALVIGAMGYINAQLKAALRRQGYETMLAESVEEVEQLITNHDYQYVILELNIPTSDEGLRMLDGLKKSVILHGLNFKIIVMSGESALPCFQQEIISRGADRFFVREHDWQSRLLKFIQPA